MAIELSIEPLMNSCGKTLITYNQITTIYDSTNMINVPTTTSTDIYVLKGAYKINEIANSAGLIHMNDIKIIANGSDVTWTPSVEDTITIGSTTYQIINIKKIDKGSSVICMIFQVR